MAGKSRAIPEFPGIDKSKAAPPKPPKYLEITAAATVAGGGRKAEIIKLEDDARGPPALRMLNPGNLAFVNSELTTSTPPKTYDQPAHRYKTKVNSSSEAKGQAQERVVAERKLAQQQHHQQYDDLTVEGGGGGGAAQTRGMPPKFIGTTYTHIVNAPSRGFVPPPKAPTLPRPYVPPSKNEFSESPLLSNRMPDGTILGALSRRHMDPAHVPYLSTQAEAKAAAPMPNVGPDNPVIELNATWSACWDDEARSVYYYNQETGEATWVPPNLGY